MVSKIGYRPVVSNGDKNQKNVNLDLGVYILMKQG